MRIENLIIIALIAALVYFGFIKKKAPSAGISTTTQLPPPGQSADGDGGAARALIQEGADVVNNLIDHAFDRSSSNTPPSTQTATI